MNAAFLFYLGQLSNRVIPNINKVNQIENFLSVTSDARTQLNEYLISDRAIDSTNYFSSVQKLEQEAISLTSGDTDYFLDIPLLFELIDNYKSSLTSLYQASIDDESLNDEVIFQLNLDINNDAEAIEEHLIAVNAKQSDKLLQDIQESEYFGYWLMAICLVLSIIATIVLYYRLIRPLRVLRKEIKSLSEGVYAHIDIERKDEIGDLISAFNITSRSLYESEQKLKVSNRKLQIANQELQSFAYSVSHDLRSPLRSISGFSDALMNSFSSELSDKAKDYLSRVHSAAERMGELIDEILKLSRISRQQVDRKKIDFTALVKEIIQLIETDALEKVNITIEPNLILFGDKGLTKVLTLNLITNAVKFSINEEHPSIQVGAVAKNGEDYVFIKDNGVGFNMKYVDKVFTPFQRLHTDTNIQGNGIGMATVKSIVTKHDGDIFIESQENKGTTVYFNLGGTHE